MKWSSAEARRVIESIQRQYYLHPDDLAFREQNPETAEAHRQLGMIRRFEGALDL
jgi:hypothetical protein